MGTLPIFFMLVMWPCLGSVFHLALIIHRTHAIRCMTLSKWDNNHFELFTVPFPVITDSTCWQLAVPNLLILGLKLTSFSTPNDLKRKFKINYWRIKSLTGWTYLQGREKNSETLITKCCQMNCMSAMFLSLISKSQWWIFCCRNLSGSFWFYHHPSLSVNDWDSGLWKWPHKQVIVQGWGQFLMNWWLSFNSRTGPVLY